MSPAEDGQVLFRCDLLVLAFAFAASSESVGEMRCPRRMRPAEGVRILGAEETVGNLQQHAGTIAGLRVRSNRTAVVQVAQRLQTLGDDVAARNARQGRDEGDAARIMFERRIVKALRLADPGKGMSSCHRTNSLVEADEQSRALSATGHG